MLVENIFRRFTQLKSGQAQINPRITTLESVAHAQVEQARFEQTRAGLRFDIGFLATVTGIAPVQAIPTTAAQWLLYNSAKTKVVSIDEIGATLVSGTAGAGIVVLGGLVATGALPTAVPATNQANIVTNPRHDGSTKPGKTSSLVVAAAQTLLLAPPGGWRVLAQAPSAATAVLSTAAIQTGMDGSLIIPPGQGLALCVTSPAGTTPLFVPHCVYTEFDTDLEQ